MTDYENAIKRYAQARKVKDATKAARFAAGDLDSEAERNLMVARREVEDAQQALIDQAIADLK